LYNLAFLDDLGDSEVADLDSFLTVKQDVVKLDVPVNHRPAVDVRQSVKNLLEYELAVTLLERSTLLYQS